eukprot:CAMPEP_0179065320 /NCGR_PEP_ID=MMETSP0796-20121207/28398_1 /TAXON_ID=73915 /ORGANISM="Pyrodinium bahamense, Strain pbaha01" /LENGTH=37 /DNA_ID= /DNA_START= /DNA_END= /DNA_ORIENTATION=
MRIFVCQNAKKTRTLTLKNFSNGEYPVMRWPKTCSMM